MILIGSEASGPLKMYSFAVYKIIWRRKGGFEPPPAYGPSLLTVY